MKPRRLRLCWTCSDFVSHEHRTWAGAWLCGRFQWLRRKFAAAHKWLTYKSVPHFCPTCKRLRYSDVPRGTSDAELALERVCVPCWEAYWQACADVVGRPLDPVTDRLIRQAMRQASDAGLLQDLLR